MHILFTLICNVFFTYNAQYSNALLPITRSTVPSWGFNLQPLQSAANMLKCPWATAEPDALPSVLSMVPVYECMHECWLLL